MIDHPLSGAVHRLNVLLLDGLLRDARNVWLPCCCDDCLRVIAIVLLPANKRLSPFFSGIGDNSRCSIRPFTQPLENSFITVCVPERPAPAHIAERTHFLRDLLRAADAAI